MQVTSTTGLGICGPLVAGKFSERAFGFDPVRRQEALYDDFGVGGDHDLVAMGDGRDQAQGFAEGAARDIPVAFGIAELRLCAHFDGRVMANPDGDRDRALPSPRIFAG